MKKEINLFFSLVLRDKTALLASKEVFGHGAERANES